MIKTYSPNLMVHPYLRQSHNMKPSESVDSIAAAVIGMLSRLHVLVVGPGLVRDKAMQETAARVLSEARKRNLPFVLDADGLLLACQRPELVKGYLQCILTPNVVEFGRLAEAMGIDVKKGDPEKVCEEVAKAYGGITIIQKGSKDVISNGSHTLASDGEGGHKRSGGQGDTLTGCLATLLAYRKAYLDKLWKHQGDLSEEETLQLSAYGGSAVTRECSRLAFQEKGRSMQAGDMNDKVHQAFLNIIGEKSSRL